MILKGVCVVFQAEGAQKITKIAFHIQTFGVSPHA